MVDDCTGSKVIQRTVVLGKESRRRRKNKKKKKKKKKTTTTTGNIIQMISYIRI